MPVYKIKKRSGKVVEFSQDKISASLRNALESVGDYEYDESVVSLVGDIMDMLERKYPDKVPDAQAVHDIVYEVLKQIHQQAAENYDEYSKKKVEKK